MINYEKEYKNSHNVCGEPFPEIVEFLRITMMNVLLFLILVADKDEMLCLLPVKNIRFYEWIRLKPVLKKCWKKRKVKI